MKNEVYTQLRSEKKTASFLSQQVYDAYLLPYVCSFPLTVIFREPFRTDFAFQQVASAFSLPPTEQKLLMRFACASSAQHSTRTSRGHVSLAYVNDFPAGAHLSSLARTRGGG